MKKLFIFIILMLCFTSCSTYTGTLYRGHPWVASPYSWYNPYLGTVWSQPWYFNNPYIVLPRYQTTPRIRLVQPPTRYQRRITTPNIIPNRPSRGN